MCSFMTISHRGDVTDSNLPRAHHARASMRAGIRARHEATCLGARAPRGVARASRAAAKSASYWPNSMHPVHGNLGICPLD